MDFQRKVLALTSKIPNGKVTTYALIAKKLKTEAYRAVGTALRHNEHPIIIPCHRVVKSNWTLGGYAGKMNNPKKAMLLRKEGIMINGNKILEFEKVIHRF